MEWLRGLIVLCTTVTTIRNGRRQDYEAYCKIFSLGPQEDCAFDRGCARSFTFLPTAGCLASATPSSVSCTLRKDSDDPGDLSRRSSLVRPEQVCAHGGRWLSRRRRTPPARPCHTNILHPSQRWPIREVWQIMESTRCLYIKSETRVGIWSSLLHCTRRFGYRSPKRGLFHPVLLAAPWKKLIRLLLGIKIRRLY